MNEESDAPWLALFYEPGSFPVFLLAEAARDLCKILWVIDSEHPVGNSLRILGRLGSVVDVTGLTAPEVGARLRDRGAAGVITYSDVMIEAAAAAAEHAALIYHSSAVAARLRDKFLQRDAMHGAGLEGPPFRLVPTGTSAEARAEIIAGVSLPAVVKPTRGNSSRDVMVVRSRPELTAAVASDVDEDLLIEGFLEDPDPLERRAWQLAPGRAAGDFVSVESVVEHGEPHHLFLTGRFPVAAPVRETGSFLPSDVPADEAAPIYDLVTAAIRALGVQQGFLHTEVKLTPGGPRIIEVNGRIGGGIPQLVSLTGGPDLLRWSMSQALGDPARPLVPPRSGVGYFLWEQPPMDARRVATISGVAEIAAIPGVADVSMRRVVGDAVDWHEGGQAHVYAVEGSAPDHAALWERRIQIMSAAHVTYAV